MRAKSLLPAAILAVLLATPALAQGPAPGPVTLPAPAPADVAPPPPPPPPGMPGRMAGPGGPPMMREGPDHHRRHHRMMPPPPPRGEAAGLAPSIRLRRGDIDLDMQCSVRETAQECAEAALAVLDSLQPYEPGADDDAARGAPQR